LGSIGSGKKSMLQNAFNPSAVPAYKTPIKVKATPINFNKRSFKLFTKAKDLQSADVSIRYVDSIPKKPNYLRLSIADKVGLIKALNDRQNQNIKTYLSINKHANVLTDLSIAVNDQDFEDITKADGILLTESGAKTYALHLYKGNKKARKINFNQGVIFEYKAAYCCWQENYKHQLQIVDLVNSYNSCPNKTYRASKQAKRKNNTYKF
jgi:hypothetical protein